jgi:uncharacterized integral membrane protein (TIGR00697 family)
MDKSKNYISYRYLDAVIALFTAVLITSNVASSAKIIALNFSVFGINLAFDGGTLLFPVAYVIGDLLTEVYGFRVARRAIWIGFAVLAISALFFLLLRILPAESIWETYAGSAAYDSILGGMSKGGIVIASLAGYLVGEFFNSIIHSRIKVLMEGRLLWVRTIGSSIAGELLDSLVFVGIATLTGVFPAELFVTLVFTNYLFKLLIEVLVTPFTYLSVWRLKKAEGVDIYDRGVRYNPFGFG